MLILMAIGRAVWPYKKEKQTNAPLYRIRTVLGISIVKLQIVKMCLRTRNPQPPRTNPIVTRSKPWRNYSIKRLTYHGGLHNKSKVIISCQIRLPHYFQLYHIEFHSIHIFITYNSETISENKNHQNCVF